MIMVPIYAISSLIALFSLEAAFVIDAIRDIYEVSAPKIAVPLYLGMGVWWESHLFALDLRP